MSVEYIFQKDYPLPMHLLMRHLVSVLQGLQAKLFQLRSVLGRILEKRDQRRNIVGGGKQACLSLPDARAKIGCIGRENRDRLRICIEDNPRLLIRDGWNHQSIAFANQRE